MSNAEFKKEGLPLRAKRCETCDAYQPDPKQLRVGLCCFEPPKAVPLANGGAMGIRPPVQATDFCVERWASKSEVRGQRSEGGAGGAGGQPGQPGGNGGAGGLVI